MMAHMAKLWAQALRWMGIKSPSAMFPIDAPPPKVRSISKEDQVIARLEREDRDMRRAIGLIREERDIIQGRRGGPK